jgi:hypothetical protein
VVTHISPGGVLGRRRGPRAAVGVHRLPRRKNEKDRVPPTHRAWSGNSRPRSSDPRPVSATGRWQLQAAVGAGARRCSQQRVLAGMEAVARRAWRGGPVRHRPPPANRTIVKRNEITPSAAAADLTPIAARLDALNTAIGQIRTGFESFIVGADGLERGDFEIGFLIPRPAVDDELQRLGKDSVV